MMGRECVQNMEAMDGWSSASPHSTHMPFSLSVIVSSIQNAHQTSAKETGAQHVNLTLKMRSVEKVALSVLYKYCYFFNVSHITNLKEVFVHQQLVERRSI